MLLAALIPAIASLAGGAMASASGAKQGAMGQATAANQNVLDRNRVTLEMQPTSQGGAAAPNTTPTQPVPSAAPPSAQGRTLESFDNNQMSPPPGISNEGVPPPALTPNYGGADPVPPTNQGDGKVMGMNGLEMAQLGMLLGSELFKRQPGPAPPGLPGGGSFNMRPVFMGR